MFQHILFATDGSLDAEQAADYTAAMAVLFHSKVTILHAFNAVSMVRSEFAFTNVEDGQMDVMQGPPAHLILSVVESVKPNAIVTGARGVSTWQGLLLGSTSMALVQRAEISVMVVK